MTVTSEATRKLSPITMRLLPLLSLVVFLLLWWLVVPTLPTDLIPTVSEVGRFMWDEITGETLAPSTVWATFGTSLWRLAVGLTISGAIGSVVGLAMGLSKTFNDAFSDFVVIGLSVPTLVWALLTGIWFGVGDTAPLLTVVMSATPFVILNMAEGVRSVPRDLVEMTSVFGVGGFTTMRQVLLPSLAPFGFAAFRYALSAGWKSLVIAEVFAAQSGAGWTIQYWKDASRAQGVFGYAIFFVLFALIVERFLLKPLSRRIFRWRDE